MIRITEKNPLVEKRFLDVKRFVSGDFYLTVGEVTVGRNYIPRGSILLTTTQVEDLVKFLQEELGI